MSTGTMSIGSMSTHTMSTHTMSIGFSRTALLMPTRHYGRIVFLLQRIVLCPCTPVFAQFAAPRAYLYTKILKIVHKPSRF